MDQKQLTNPVSFKGDGKEFFGIWIVNILLSIVTLGIYSAWAKVRTKRYFYGNTYIAESNFEYHAQPTQILKGRLVAMFLVLCWAISNSFFPLASLILLLGFYLLLPWLLRNNARFDAAMTSYRNVHFSFNGSVKEAYKTLLGRTFVVLLAMVIYLSSVGFIASYSNVLGVILGLGSIIVATLLYAWLMTGVHNYFTNGYKYGDWQFSADLESKFFISTYLKAAIANILTTVVFVFVCVFIVFGGIDASALMAGDYSEISDVTKYQTLFFALYAAIIVMGVITTAYTTTCVRNYKFSKLQAKNQQYPLVEYNFSSTLTVNGYIWLVISNFLLQVFTLGIARPWVMVRTTNYLADHTAVIGEMEYLIAQDSESDVKSAISDEVAQAFDIGVGIG